MKKVLLLFALLFMSAAVWAQTTTATYGQGNGNFYNSSDEQINSAGFTTGAYFVSNTTPAVTVQSSGAGQLNPGDGANESRLGLNNGTNTFTISVTDGYIIDSYSFECWTVTTSQPTRYLTTEYGYTNYEIVSTDTPHYNISVTGVNKQSTSFTFTTNGWAPLKTKNFKIYVRKKFYEEEKTSAAGIEDGYYVVEGRSNGLSGFWYHDTSLGDNRLFRIKSSSDKDLTYFTGNLKYVWRLTKDEDGNFTLQNIGTNAFAPADANKNANFTGAATAIFNWDSEHAAIKQTNYTDGGDLYVHCNALSGDINLSYWSSGPGSNVNDGSGSLVAPRFFKVADANINLVLSLQQKIDEVNDFKSCLGDGLHKYTTNATPSEVDAEIAIAETLYATAGAAYSEVTTEIAMLQSFIDDATLNSPATNKFYRFHIGDKYMCNVAGGDNVRTATETSNDASTIFYLNGSNYLIAYADGLGFNYGYCKPTGEDKFVLNSFAFTESSTSGYYNIHSSKGTATNQWSDRDITINGSNKLDVGAGAWTIEEVDELPVTISAAGLSTLYSPVALTIPDGVTAYVAEYNDTYLHLEAIEDGIIPAEVGVILTGTPNTSYNFDITTGGSASSALTGTVVAISRPANSYVLSGGTNGPGFYKDGAEVIPGFKAYYQGIASVKGFIGFEFDDATDIKTIENGKLMIDNVIYNVAGQRLNKMQKGINIVNGKKVLK